LELIDRLMEDTRTLTFELSSPILYELGLEAALGWLVEKTQEEHGLGVMFESHGLSRRLSEDVAVLLFQAVRELLANVIKHARASAVRVTCEQERDDVRIVVEDDGVGFDAARSVLSPTFGGGFGLFSIRERLGSLGGFVEIDSGDGRTRVTLVVPHGIVHESKRGLDDDSSAPGR
jgi:signal transduction histidine kinase